ncbi:MAG: hypothetical protein RL208_155 [Pseudomonadota bacterium]|jgi:hypothetical protein
MCILCVGIATTTTCFAIAKIVAKGVKSSYNKSCSKVQKQKEGCKCCNDSSQKNECNTYNKHKKVNP